MEVVKSGVSVKGWWRFPKSSQGQIISFTANRKCWKSIWTWTVSLDRAYSLPPKSLQKLRSQYLKIAKASQVPSLPGCVCVCVFGIGPHYEAQPGRSGGVEGREAAVRMYCTRQEKSKTLLILGGICVSAYLWRSEGNLQDGSFHHVEPRKWAQFWCTMHFQCITMHYNAFLSVYPNSELLLSIIF